MYLRFRKFSISDILVNSIQANRMRIQHGTNLWNKIDIHKFNRYFDCMMNTMQKIWMNPDYLDKIGDYGMFNSNNEVPMDLMSQIWKNVTGSAESNPFREEEWRNGGDPSSNSTTAIVIQSQYKQMKTSSLLEVELLETNPDGTLKVRYRHPDVFFDMNRLYKDGKISQSLFQNITSYSKSRLREDRTLRRSLNTMLMRDLVIKSMEPIRYTQLKSKEVSTFLQDLSTLR